MQIKHTHILDAYYKGHLQSDDWTAIDYFSKIANQDSIILDLYKDKIAKVGVNFAITRRGIVNCEDAGGCSNCIFQDERCGIYRMYWLMSLI